MATDTDGPERHTLQTLAIATLVLSVLGTVLYLRFSDDGEQAPRSESSASASSDPDAPAADAAEDAQAAEAAASAAAAAEGAAFPDDPRVLVISVDGLASYAVTRRDAPTIRALLAHGAGTLNARTAVEATVTLPNHTGMVTGRPIDGAGGHGVTWNHASTRDVAPGVSSVFATIADQGGSSALFAQKSKFEMWDRSWPGTLSEAAIEPDLRDLAASAIEDGLKAGRDLTFVHVATPDAAGHRSGWGSAAYRAAVRRADGAVARLVTAIDADPDLRRETVVVLTADHGGPPGALDHSTTNDPEDFRIPFLVWGPGIDAADLYDLNRDYADPGDAQPSYDEKPPVRNADVANLVAGLLDLPPVEASSIGVDETLDIRR